MRITSVFICLILLPMFLLAGYEYGRYTGNGAASQAISGAGFEPKVILVKGAGNQTAWVATSTMTAGRAKSLVGTAAPQTGLINSIDANGFTVGNSSAANAAGVDYFFVIWDDSDGAIDVGSFVPEPLAYNSANTYPGGSIVEFTGDFYKSNAFVNSGESPATTPSKWDITTLGTTITGDSINLGHRPYMVWSFGEGTEWYDNSQGQFITDISDPTSSKNFNDGASLASNKRIVKEITNTGFDLTAFGNAGTDNGTVRGVKYNYVAFRSIPDIEIGTYAGTAVDDRKITTSAQPDFLMVLDVAGGQNPWFKTLDMKGDSSYKFKLAVSTINIKQLQSDGFTLGIGGEVNGSGPTYEYIAFQGGNPLPVELTYFNADILKDGSVNLSWVTAVEINASHFVVQRSLDGINFENIGIKLASGNSSSLINYNLIDENPYGGINYYRLKQVDIDGGFEYYNTLVNIKKSFKTTLRIYPNPSSGIINFDVNLENLKDYNLKIIDAQGRLCYFKKVFSINKINGVDVSFLSKGAYNVLISDPNSSKILASEIFIKY